MLSDYTTLELVSIGVVGVCIILLAIGVGSIIYICSGGSKTQE